MPAPVTPSQFEEAKIAAGSSLCDKLRKFFSLGDLVFQLVEYMFDESGEPTDEFVADLRTLAVPAGSVFAHAGTTVPSGYLLCNGAAVSRTTYATLFSAIGTVFGSGDGSATFNVPDLRDRTAVGVSSTIAIADTGGAKTHTLTSSEMPGHTHAYTSPLVGTSRAVGTVVNEGGFTFVTVTADGGTTVSTGGGAAHNNMQPYIGLNYIIKT